MKRLALILLFPLFLLLTACGEDQTTGAEKVRWDREICARCAMAVSDRNYSAQVRGGRKDKRSKVYKFDDLGCAVIWLDKQNWKDDPRTEIWVNNHKDGKWINAKTAWYVKMNNTPMDYGLGAQTEKVEGALSYEEATVHIYKVEEGFNRHSGQPLVAPERIAPERAAPEKVAPASSNTTQNNAAEKKENDKK